MLERDFEFHHDLDRDTPAIRAHKHPFYEIYFYRSDSVNHLIEGRTYQLRPDDILLTSSRDIHCPVITPGRPYNGMASGWRTIF